MKHNTNTIYDTTNNPSALISLGALNTDQAADYTGLSKATLEKFRCSGGGPRFVRYSRRAVRYRVAEIDAWMDSRTVAHTSERSA